MQYKSLIHELIAVANRIGSNNDGCTPASIMADGRVCKDCNCDDCQIDVARYICGLADRLALAHKAEIKTLKKRYNTDLRDAREARDIAIKEASKLRNDVNLAEDLVHDFRSDIAIMLGISCDGMADDERMCIYEVSERVKRPEPEVLGADDLPIKVGDTVFLESSGRPIALALVFAFAAFLTWRCTR